LIISEIKIHHDRKSFDCGKRSMNDFLLNNGLSQAYGMTYVVLSESSSSEIMAYFTIDPDPVDILRGDYDDEVRPPRVVRLERLAVDKRHQRKGIGESLLIYIMRQIVQAAAICELDGLELIPLDEEAKNWYLNRDFGFVEVDEPTYALILPLSTIKQSIKEIDSTTSEGIISIGRGKLRPGGTEVQLTGAFGDEGG
jgi:GNAT superfamily N-acetyltransferase